MNSFQYPRRRCGSTAFTLIELLVVIAIIAILAGIAFPVYNVVRRRADGVACAAHLKQIAAGIFAYAGDHDTQLPGPLEPGQMATYSLADAFQLAEIMPTYLGLPAATSAVQQAPIMICPSFAKVDPALDQPVYLMDALSQTDPAGGPNTLVPIMSGGPQTSAVWAFGNNSNGSTPMRIPALLALSDQNGAPVNLSTLVMLRDSYGGSSATLVTNGGTYTSKAPVHVTFLNALFFDGHVGNLNSKSLVPQ